MLNFLTETAGTEATLEWYEKVADWFAKPQVDAVGKILIAVAVVGVIYLAGKSIKRSLKKKK